MAATARRVLGGWSRRRCIQAVVATTTTSVILAKAGIQSRRVPILAYHRFGPTVVDSMTLRLDTFASHLDLMRELGCQPVTLDALRAWHEGRADLPERAVVLTADDAHRTQHEHMAPMLRPLGWKVTLFVYPSAVSNSDYAMTWSQLAQLQAQGHAIGSHTYWHPNFANERRRLDAQAFRRFATDQLVRSRATLQQRLGADVRHLAWPFSLGGDDVAALAREAGYETACGLGNRSATRTDALMDLPRWLVTDSLRAPRLRSLLLAAFD